jgi:hypothetical protein
MSQFYATVRNSEGQALVPAEKNGGWFTQNIASSLMDGPEQESFDLKAKLRVGSEKIIEGRGVNQRNCWRGARSVSPDISPRLSAFVPTSMRRFRIGLSPKILVISTQGIPH